MLNTCRNFSVLLSGAHKQNWFLHWNISVFHKFRVVIYGMMLSEEDPIILKFQMYVIVLKVNKRRRKKLEDPGPGCDYSLAQQFQVKENYRALKVSQSPNLNFRK